jgi:signal transduction histidine kinase
MNPALFSFPGSEETDRASRLRFYEIEEEDRLLLRELYEALSPLIDHIIDDWYDFLLSKPETRRLLSEDLVRNHLKPIQARYFRSLLTGPYDAEYFRDRVRIGLVHARVGLEPPWYMGAYRKHQDLVHCHLRDAGHPQEKIFDWLRAYSKLIHLDMALALDSYFATLSREVMQANAALRVAARDLELRNEQLSQQYRRAQEASKLRQELLGRVSHELRSPLNAILGYSDLLLDGIDGPLTTAQTASVARVRHYGMRLLSMIDRLLDTAKAASAPPDPVPFDPSPIMARMADRAREAAEAKGLRFESSVDGAPRVSGDPEGFGLALGQLLDNAVTFTAVGGVRLETRATGRNASFIVTDTGAGIPLEEQERVFEPFHQLETGDTRSVGGLGIGLALARQTAESMGGALRLDGSGPEGSVFILELPLAETVGRVRVRSVRARREAGRSLEEVREGSVKTAWPRRLGDQAGLVRAALVASSGPLTANDLARSFRGASAGRVRSLLDALSALGQARDLGDGRYSGI